MKVLVIGRGVSALALVDKLSQDLSLSVQWVGPDPLSSFNNCSIHSTALVARQGIEKGISPLGDLLYDSFFKALDFFKIHNPDGVQKVVREHFDRGEEKIKRRFGAGVEKTGGYYSIKEEAFILYPPVFLKWWERRLLKNSQIHLAEDLISAIDSGVAQGLQDQYTFDFCFDCRGFGIKDHQSFKENFKVVPGHYLEWEKDLGEISWVKTCDGHNLIYHHALKKLILGGSSEKSEVMSPTLDQLKEQIKAFVNLDPTLLDVLHLEDALIKTGMRTKASKRMPFQKLLGANQLILGGFYKNGYTLCFSSAEEALLEFRKIVGPQS